jgi:hypothetical protein
MRVPRPTLPSSPRRALGGFITALATACASVQGRNVAVPVDAAGNVARAPLTASGLIVSGEELASYSSRHFGLIEVTFENFTDEWLHVDRIALDFGGAERNEGVFLPEGADLIAWHAATVNRNDIRGTNAATALGALLALGTIVALAGRASGRREAAAAGGIVALGAATTVVIGENDARIDRAERAPRLPETHLLAVPFAIPPGLFAKRWVLLNTRSSATPCIASMLIDYHVEPGNERVRLPLRRGAALSEWQPEACARSSPSTRQRRR